MPTYNPGGGMQAGAQRLGELAGDGSKKFAPFPRTALIRNQDGSRFTVPYKINSQYFTDNGGNDRDVFDVKLKAMKPKLSQQNEYVKSYQCRGHFFMGSRTAGQGEPSKRYNPSCWK